MNREALARATSVAQLIAAGVLAVMAARFGFAGITHAVAERSPTLASAAASVPAPPPPPPSPPPPPTAPPVRSAVKVGTSLRLSLMVTAGPDRSEVLVDGVSVGRSPFVGEVTCRAGERIRIELVPPKGLPKSFERGCAPGTLRIE